MARAVAKYEIRADDKTKKAFDSVGTRIEKAKGAFRGMGSALVGLAGAAGLGSLVKSSLNAADEIQKLAIQTGASTEFLSEMKHVADLSGVAFESFTKALRNQARVIVDTAEGGKEYADTFAKLNLNAEELVKLSPEQQFERIAAALSQVESETQRSAIAQELFGGRASEVLRIINQGTGAMAAMRAEARELGLSLDRDAADSAANANDAITRLTGAFKGVGLSIASDFASPLTDAVDFLRGTVVPAFGFFLDLILRVGKAFGGFAAAAAAFVRGDFSGAFSAFKGAISDLGSGIALDAEKRVNQGSAVLDRLGQRVKTEPNEEQKRQTEVLEQINQNVQRGAAAVTS